MKEILISIKPEQVEKIASGDLTILVRKTRPKLEPPFKCYIYCTKATKNGEPLLLFKDGTMCFADYRNADGVRDCFVAEGTVIGEFICDRIDTYFMPIQSSNGGIPNINSIPKEYDLHISYLNIYNKPTYHDKFGKPCEWKQRFVRPPTTDTNGKGESKWN